MRTYAQQTRTRMLAAIRRIVTAECQASGSPRDPDFETFDSFLVTDNDDATTRRVAAAFSAHFGDSAAELSQQTASEDFSDIHRAAGIPYNYRGIGGTDPQTCRTAEKAGRVQTTFPPIIPPGSCPCCSPPCAPGPRR